MWYNLYALFLKTDQILTTKGCTCFFYKFPKQIPIWFGNFACLIFMILQKKFKVTKSFLKVTDDIKNYCLKKPRPTTSTLKVTMKEVTVHSHHCRVADNPSIVCPQMRQLGLSWCPRQIRKIKNSEKAVLENFWICWAVALIGIKGIINSFWQVPGSS